MAEQTGLPASFEVAWGLRDRPTKGPRPALSLEKIVDAAVDLASAEGLDGVSMSRVAKELGTSAMSLYRYVAAKDELLMLMIDGALGRVEWTVTGDTWRERLTDWAGIMLDAYRRYPWVVRIPITGAPITPNQLRFAEQGLRALAGTGLAEHEKLSTILLITNFARSFALMSADLTAALMASGDARAMMANYGDLIRRLTPEEEFPALRAVVDAGTFDDVADMTNLDYDFTFGLDRILDGVEALMHARE